MNKYTKVLLVPMIIFGINSDSAFCTSYQEKSAEQIKYIEAKMHQNPTKRTLDKISSISQYLNYQTISDTYDYRNATNKELFRKTAERASTFIFALHSLLQYKLPVSIHNELITLINQLLNDISNNINNLDMQGKIYINTFMDDLRELMKQLPHDVPEREKIEYLLSYLQKLSDKIQMSIIEQQEYDNYSDTDYSSDTNYSSDEYTSDSSDNYILN